jgi:hypothetical protein
MASKIKATPPPAKPAKLRAYALYAVREDGTTHLIEMAFFEDEWKASALRELWDDSYDKIGTMQIREVS